MAITDRQNATALDTLAAANARADRLTEAIETAEEAVTVARTSGDGELATQISARLDGYRTRSK